MDNSERKLRSTIWPSHLRNICDVTVCQLIISFSSISKFRFFFSWFEMAGFALFFFFFGSVILIRLCNQRSLASYIKKYACSNAKTEDLWAVLEEGSGEPVKELMNSWTKKKGYPVVSVKVEENKLVFEQVSCVLSHSPILS
jgi:hypothetical protein